MSSYRPTRQPRIPNGISDPPKTVKSTKLVGSPTTAFANPAYKPLANQIAAGQTTATKPTSPVFDPSTDPAYQATLANLTKIRDDTLAAIPGQETSTLADYGYTAQGIDPATGAPSGLAFDPTNPYSRQALLRKHYTSQQGVASTNYAARGLGQSGAAQAAVQTINGQQLQSNDALLKALGQALAGIVGGGSQAKQAYGTGVTNATQDALSRFIAGLPAQG